MITAVLAGASAAAAAAEIQPICADRPSRSTGTCTVPLGIWQAETGLVDWSHDRSDGETGDLTTIGASLIKYGVSPNADVELGVTPIESVRTEGGGTREHHSSFGDVIARVKYRLSSEDAPVQVSLDPFVKIPTANHHLGNGKVEGGILVPIAAQLGSGPLTLSFGPEVDVLADTDGGGRHLASQQVANLELQASRTVSLSAELWAMRDWDPAGTGKQESVDGSIAWIVNNNLQLDAGANFGLNRQTPDVELYTGVSVRF